MRAAKVLALLAIAALGIGSLSAVALAGKKKTNVAFSNQSPNFNNGQVSANGKVVSVCGPPKSLLLFGLSMRLQVLDTNGVVLTTLDGSKSNANGRWTLSGQLPTTLPAGTNYVRVKAKKQTIGKVVHHDPVRHTEGRDVCHAGFSPTVAIPAA